MTSRSVDPQAVTYVRASLPGKSKWFATAQDRMLVKSGEAQAFQRFRVAVPERRELVSASLEMRSEDPFTGSLTMRSVAVSGSYQQMSWDTRPTVVAGSADRTAAVSGKVITADVTADVASVLAASGERIAFRLDAGSTSSQWIKTPSVALVLTTRPVSVDPTDLAPSGTVGIAKPTFRWTAPTGITQVRLQVSADSTFATTAYDSTLTKTVPEVDTSTGPSWSGLSGTMYVRAQHFTAAGWSGWQTVTVTYSALTNFVVSNPTASDGDPTPPSVWTPAASAVEIVTYRDGQRVGTTGIVPGPLTTLTPDLGAKKAGEVLRRVHRFYDGVARTEPPFVERVTETTFTPTATVAGLDSLTVSQAYNLPAVDVSWTRATVPDEVALYHGDNLAGTEPGTTQPVRDWTVPPNTDVAYGVRAVVNGQHSDALKVAAIRTRVGGVWLVDPETETGFVLAGTDGLSISYGGEVVVNTPIDGAVLLRRTLTRRGPEGTIAGTLDPTESLPSAWSPDAQLAAVGSFAETPGRVLRLICGDLNIPVVCSHLQAVFDPRLTRVAQVWHTVTFDFSHAGDA